MLSVIICCLSRKNVLLIKAAKHLLINHNGKEYESNINIIIYFIYN